MAEAKSILEGEEMIRVVQPSRRCIGGWKYEGVQSTPEFFEVGGVKIPLLTDKQVYTSTRSLFIDTIESNIEQFIGTPQTRHLPGVKPSVEPSPLLQQIAITADAYEKTVAYAELMGELYSPVPEVAMHLLRHPEAPRGLITDVVACQNQRVTTTSCRFSEYLGLEYDHERYYSGWSHSHAIMPAYHSSTDDNNVKRAVRTGGLRTKFHIGDFLVNVQYMPSLVVNAVGGEPYGAIGISYYSPRDQEDYTFIREVPVSLKEEEFSIDREEECLRRQLLEYVTVI